MTCTERLQIRDRADWGRDMSCKRAAVEDGLCGLHLAARNRRREKDEAEKAARKREQERMAMAEQRRHALYELGMPHGAMLEYKGFRDGGYTGRLTLSPEALDWLIERLGQ